MGKKLHLPKEKALSATSKFRNLFQSIGVKLFAIFVVSIIIFVFTVGMISYTVSKQAIEKKVTQSSYQTIIQVAEKIDMLMKQYEKMSMQLMFDASIKSNIEYIRALDTSSYDYIQAVSKLEEALLNYTLGNDLINEVYIIPINAKDGKMYTSQAMRELPESVSNSEWFAKAIKLDGKLVWTDMMKSGLNSSKQSTFGVARTLQKIGSTESEYVVLIEIKGSAIDSIISSIDLGEESTIQAITKAGSYMIAKDHAELMNEAVPAWLIPNEDSSTNKLWSGTYNADSDNGDAMLTIYHEIAASDWLLVGTVPVKVLVKDANMILMATFIIMFVAAIIAVGIGYFVMRMISKPLKQLSNLMNEGAQGKLSVRAVSKSNDEIGQLSKSFNIMMEQISDLVRQTEESAKSVLETATYLSEASRTTAVSAREIAVATEEIAKGATSLATEAERGNELTNDMASQMQRVVQANQMMDQSVHQVDESSSLGVSNMASLMDRTDSTSNLMQSLAERVNKLSESTAHIRKIMDVLNGMTKQTNILSLNATIEAARAGTAGKGFMVVADEIRNLADQSHNSIDVVNQITERIQQEIKETVDALSSVFPIFEMQSEAVKETDSIFGQVRDQMSGMIGSLDYVTGSLDQLNQAQSTLVEAMSNVSAVAEEASATSEEVASLSGEQLNIASRLVELSQQLEVVSTQLKDSLSHFSLK